MYRGILMTEKERRLVSAVIYLLTNVVEYGDQGVVGPAGIDSHAWNARFGCLLHTAIKNLLSLTH